MLENVFKFRYKIMHDELSFIQPTHDKQEIDEYDHYSDQFAVLNPEGNICAVIRLIHHSPIGYPTQQHCNFHPDEQHYEQQHSAELSRIFIDPVYRNMRDTKTFIRGLVLDAAYPKMKEYGVKQCYGSLEKTFLKLVNMIRIPYKSIGDAQYYLGANRYPSILTTDELEACNPELLKTPQSQNNHTSKQLHT